MVAHEPHGNVSTVCAHGILAAKHKGKVEVLHRRPHMCLWKSRRNHDTHVAVLPTRTFPALWMTLLCSMMLENNSRNYGKCWFDDTTMMMSKMSEASMSDTVKGDDVTLKLLHTPVIKEIPTVLLLIMILRLL